MSKKYDVAAYIWPAYTGDEKRTRIFWPEGYGEWQTVKNHTKKYEGDTWPRKPLWGYQNEADPYVMEMQIEAAVDHGVNVFIYDWYWYDGRPFLEQCLNDGFLKAKNNKKMKFYIMWANHDANSLWDKRTSGDPEVVWRGAIDEAEFRKVGTRWLEQYFRIDNYYKIDGKPVVSIYDIANFVNGLGGYENAKKSIAWLNEEAKKYGLPGVHFQYVKWGDENNNFTGVDSSKIDISGGDFIVDLGFESVTNYQFVHFMDMDRDYGEIIKELPDEYEKIRTGINLPYFPHVSVGWDNNPRYIDKVEPVCTNATPDKVEEAMRMAKAYADKYNNVPLVVVNSWNEWTETSYLEPDDLYGYGYLEAIKKVFVNND